MQENLKSKILLQMMLQNATVLEHGFLNFLVRVPIIFIKILCDPINGANPTHACMNETANFYTCTVIYYCNFRSLTIFFYFKE